MKNHQTAVARTFHFSPTVSINYEVHGEGQHPLVLLHGFGASLETWRDIQPLLQSSFSLYLIDLKGSGLSSKPKDGHYSLEDQSEMVASLISSLGLRKVTLVGHSYGGAVALMTCLRLQNSNVPQLSHLVLIDSPAYPQHFPFFVKAVRTPVLSAIVNLAPAHLRASYTLKHIFFDPKKVSEARIERYARFLDLPGAHYALTQYARQVIPHDVDTFVASLPSIHLPTLLLWGRDDTVIPLAIGERLKNDIPGAVLEILSDCGHVPQEELPKAAAQIIHRFLAEGGT